MLLASPISYWIPSDLLFVHLAADTYFLFFLKQLSKEDPPASATEAELLPDPEKAELLHYQ